MKNLQYFKIAKEIRFFGEDNFHKGARLNISFEEVAPYLSNFSSVVGFNEDGAANGKPRFDAIVPMPHCDMPLLSEDYYLIGFTDSVNSSTVKFRFYFDDCGGEYLNNHEDLEKWLSQFESFSHDCFVVERRW